jgi:two-component system, NtrC family, response regulator AtoC
MGTSTTRVIEPLTEAGFVYGQSSAVESLNAMVADISRTDIPVLILGESGSGKEVYARLLHRLSGFSEGPLRKFSCSTLDSGRLLGQIREGLRSGAEAGGVGSVFLDGVDELDLACQRVLLSLLPDGEPKSGSGDMVARLISSTSRNLEKEIEAGRFRKELYFRINGVSLRLPPLRERKEDIPALVDYFLAKHSAQLKKKTPLIDSEAMELLNAYDWPGNIRELENVAKKMVAFGESRAALGDLRIASVGVARANDGAGVSSLKVAARAASRRTERELILRALERTHWNRKRAALELQISYKSLLYKIKQIGVQGSDSEG